VLTKNLEFGSRRTQWPINAANRKSAAIFGRRKRVYFVGNIWQQLTFRAEVTPSFDETYFLGTQFDSHRPLQIPAKFTLIRLPLLTGQPSICSIRWGFAPILRPSFTARDKLTQPGAEKSRLNVNICIKNLSLSNL
jgi:hypothetical protein